MAANQTQILNFKANFNQEFKLFKKKNYANNLDWLALHSKVGSGIE